MKKKYIFLLSFTFTVLCLKAQIVNIPDPIFKNYLVQDTTINTNVDSEIQVSEASAFTGVINCSNLNISDLTGIEFFTDLTSLNCDNNQLTHLNITQNTNLLTLWCNYNQLTSLDVTQNKNLTLLRFDNNQIANIDITQNTDLRTFSCKNNQLTNLNITQNTNLRALNCSNNQLTKLDINKNTEVVNLKCSYNHLANIDVNYNTKLDVFYCDYNQLTSLEIPKNTDIRDLNCNNNKLQRLKIKKEGNDLDLNATHNPLLTCIEVGNIGIATVVWWSHIDSIASFSTNCNYTSGVEDDNIQLIRVSPNPTNGYFTLQTGLTHENTTIRIIDVLGKVIETSVIKPNVTSTPFDISKEIAGLYFVEVKTGNEIRVIKIIKK